MTQFPMKITTTPTTAFEVVEMDIVGPLPLTVSGNKPQTQGSLERSHHSLIEYLKMYINDSHWDTWIRYAIFSYNTSIHTAHGFTPHELIFARKARIPSEFTNTTISKTYNDILDDIARKLNIT
ncbi:hypothetical protein TKK_0016118 [Trichogramma kaykai]